MVALTLLEAAKLNDGLEHQKAIAELYAGSSDILAALKFQNIQGNALMHNRQEALPGTGFRAVNGTYSATVGVLNPVTDTLAISGGEVDVDRAILKSQGMEQRAVQEAMQVRSLALNWTDKFINGDTDNDAKEFDGLVKRIVNDQLISAGTTSGGAALSLDKMDELIDQVDFPTHIIMNKAMKRKFIKAARTTSVSGNVTQDKDQMGKTIHMYNGLPILTVDLNASSSAILGFDEAASTGGATATSIYCVNMGPGGVMGLQNGGLEVKDLGELDSAPLYRTRIEWMSGMAIFNGRAAARLQHIGDLDIVA
jgi:hypothetical protein